MRNLLSVFKKITRKARIFVSTGALAALFGVSMIGGASAGELLDVRFGVSNANATRIVFDIRGPFSHVISGSEMAHGRLYIDLADTQINAGLRKSDAGKGHIANYRISAGKNSAVRIEIRFLRAAKIVDTFLIEPSTSNKNFRLVVDLQTSNKDQFLASLPEPVFGDIVDVIKAATASETAPSAEQAAQQQSQKTDAQLAHGSPKQETTVPATRKAETPVQTAKALAVKAPSKQAKNEQNKATTAKDWPVIVVDAGHGGSDPGAAGQNGARESTVTLAAALKLADLLKKTGRYRVVLTRASDQRLAHEQRIQMARTSGANLFISLHADSHKDPELRGGSVYTLSEKGTERSAKEAREQGNYTVYGEDIGDFQPVVGGILLDVAQSKTNNESSKFAAILIGNLKGATPLLNNTHRTGNFKVLLSPDVPAVLLELAFISNIKDEANLVSDTWRAKAMKATAKAIDLYFERSLPKRHAANSASRRQ